CIGIGGAAATHHSGNYAPIFVHIPGFRVVMPSNAYDAKGLFANALQCNDPVLFLEHKSLIFTKGAVPDEEYTIPFGKARIAHEGDAATIVTLSSMVPKSVATAEKLAKEGINIEVVDLRTVAP